MAHTYPQFNDHPDRIIRFLEIEGLRRLVYGGCRKSLVQHHPELENIIPYATDAYNQKKKDKHKALMLQLGQGAFTTIDAYYDALKALLKPKARGKALADKKKRTGQKAYQQDKLGDAFINNNRLISAAKEAAKELADQGADDSCIDRKAEVLAGLYAWDSPLSASQLCTLKGLMKAQVSKHLKLDRIEAAILDEENKNLYFMYGKIKRNYVVGDTFTLGTEEASKLCRCSKSDVGKLMGRLVKLGFLSLIQKGKRGSNTMRASLYRREA